MKADSSASRTLKRTATALLVLLLLFALPLPAARRRAKPAPHPPAPPPRTAITLDSVAYAEGHRLLESGQVELALALFCEATASARSKGWSLSVALLCDRSSVAPAVRDLRQKRSEPVFVLYKVYKGAPCYRLCLGLTADRNTAAALARELPVGFKEHGPFPFPLKDTCAGENLPPAPAAPGSEPAPGPALPLSAAAISEERGATPTHGATEPPAVPPAPIPAPEPKPDVAPVTPAPIPAPEPKPDVAPVPPAPIPAPEPKPDVAPVPPAPVPAPEPKPDVAPVPPAPIPAPEPKPDVAPVTPAPVPAPEPKPDVAPVSPAPIPAPEPKPDVAPVTPAPIPAPEPKPDVAPVAPAPLPAPEPKPAIAPAAPKKPNPAAEMWFQQGLSAQGQGRRDEARRCYEQALLLEPDKPETLNNLAVLHLLEGRFPEARGLLERVVAARPAYGRAHLNLAGALWGLGEKDLAMDEARKACRLDVGDVSPHLTLASFLMALGRIDEAKAEARVVLALEPGNARARALLGEAAE